MKANMPCMALLVSAVALICTPVSGQEAGFGLGITVGEPVVGLSCKLWVWEYAAFDAAFIGWPRISLSDEGSGWGYHFHIDHVFQHFTLSRQEHGSLQPYYGIGLKLSSKLEGTFGIRVPVGLDYVNDERSSDVFLEVVHIWLADRGGEPKRRLAFGFRHFWD